MEPVVKSSKLEGHRGAVTCLDHSSSCRTDSDFLLSGSEDGTARLWDPRGRPHASLCIITPSQVDGESLPREVSSVSFAPVSAERNHMTGPIESTFALDYSVYISSGPVCYKYDLRNASSPLVTLNHSNAFFQAEDDINHMALSSRGSKAPSMVALADDAGHVTLLNQASGDITATLVHDDRALVMSAVVRPNYDKAMQIASGGTDCTVKLWDASKPRKPLDTAVVPGTATNANQVCNPPMVNGLAWSPSGQLLAAALGDGSCAVFLVSNHRSLVLASRMEEAHSGPVALVLFPMRRPDAPSRDRLLCSAGNDRNLVLWDLGSSLCGDASADPARLFPGRVEADPLAEPDGSEEGLPSRPRTLFAWRHPAKPNWAVGGASPSTLFLADTTNDITAYSLPMN